ncbi:MAG: glycosyltransferase family 2 protein, partial [Okeania sp. SIO2D1]|nr:glycosyltransferase family 2 protein [Okeania sp. SIO2D1]
SVQNQTFTDWEHIVVDDGSTDNSAQVVSSYVAQEPRLRLIQQPNGGMQNARKAGLRASSSQTQYLSFLDSDDKLAPQMLELTVSYLEQNPQVGLTFCNHYIINTEDKILKTYERLRVIPSRFWVKELPQDTPQTPFIAVGCGACLEPTTMIRRSIYEKTSGWREGEGDGHEGIELLLQIALLSEVHFLPQNLYYYRLHPKQTSWSIDYDKQMDKLLVKWKKGTGFTEEEKAKYSELALFYRRRFLPYYWSRQAKRFYPKAFLLYLKSFSPL